MLRIVVVHAVLRSFAQHRFLLSLSGCLTLLLLGCGNGMSNQAISKHQEGMLVGRVTQGPVSPVIEPGQVYAPVPAYAVEIIVRALGGRVVSITTTDETGHFRITLAPGRYEVTLGLLAGGAISKDVPATVAIEGNSETRIDIRVDTRIRGPVN